MIRMPDKIRQVIALLEAQGHQAWLVGGSVRDGLLGQSPRDWDISTSASLDEAQNLLSQSFRIVPIGAKFGTISLISPKLKCEVSTFQGNLIQDLARRDFTINAMAWHPRWGLQDPHGGREDLRAQIIRCPDRADEIFTADPLRMVRGARFSAQLGFRIEGQTMAAIKDLYSLIADTSPQRIREELSAILVSQDPVLGFELLRETGLLQEILPELQACVGFDQHHPNHDKDVYQHILAVVANTPRDLTLRLAALFHDIAKPLCLTIDEKGIGHFYGHEGEGEKLAGQIMRRLGYSNYLTRRVGKLVSQHMQRINYPKMNPAKLLARVGKDNIENLFVLQDADARGGSGRSPEAIHQMRSLVAKALAEGRPFSRADLAISGRDLLSMGFPPGVEIGRILNKLLDAVIKDPDLNNKQELIKMAAAHSGGRV